ncbi:hypothetical protein TCAP_01729 [Tolypocladium capitatum]|uniref:Uncharacterized protein n=1 Tax=Tolypocladium capitatum TaxID=45235 RepID=A0A2K3QLD5_9HYPO|nr:hypothetical protein TCAP_01729 [Tolypocladium capitatum]
MREADMALSCVLPVGNGRGRCACVGGGAVSLCWRRLAHKPGLTELAYGAGSVAAFAAGKEPRRRRRCALASGGGRWFGRCGCWHVAARRETEPACSTNITARESSLAAIRSALAWQSSAATRDSCARWSIIPNRRVPQRPEACCHITLGLRIARRPSSFRMQHPARPKFCRRRCTFDRRSRVLQVGGCSSGHGGVEPSQQPLPRLPHPDRRTVHGFVAVALRIHSGDDIH